MKFLLNLAKPIIKKQAPKLVDENREVLVGIINAKVDLPKLTEEEESKLFEQIYDALGDAVVAVVEKI